MQDDFFQLRADAKQRLILVEQETPFPMFRTLQGWVHDYPAPIGVVWYSLQVQNCISIDNIYVLDQIRKCGVATALQKGLEERYPGFDFVTGHSTADGQAWLTKVGYVKTDFGWEKRLGKNDPALMAMLLKSIDCEREKRGT
jgi:hypothetical protein